MEQTADINRKALKSGFWYTIGNFLVKSMGFISTPIFTRLLTQAEFGLYNNYLSWISIFTVFVTINLEASLISAKNDYKIKFGEYVFSLVVLTIIMGGIWSIGINMFASFFTGVTNISQFYLNSMVIYIVFTAIINLYQAKERYNYGYKKTVLIGTIMALSSTVLSILLVLNFNNKFCGRVIGATIPNIVIGTVLLLFLKTKITSEFLSFWKYALIICIPYIPHILAGSVLGSTDKIMIQQYWGPESTALYSLAYNCGMMVTLLTLSVNAAYSPWLSDKLVLKEYDLVKKVSRVYATSFMYAVIGIMLMAPEILLLLGGKNYCEAQSVIPPVAMGCACQFIYTMYVNLEQIKKKTVGMAIATVIAALINLGLNILFIPKLGYLAAAYTTLVGYVFLLIIHIYVVKKLDMGFVYDTRFLLFLMGSGVIIMLLITALYGFTSIRYIAIILYMIVLVLVLNKYKGFIFMYFRNRHE